jgi:hypothetical protein
MILSKVDFPQPEGPTKHTNCPSSILSVTSLTAATIPSVDTSADTSADTEGDNEAGIESEE